MNIEAMELRYKQLCEQKSEIDEHLPTLRETASQCNIVCELGTGLGRSTTSLILGAKGLVTSCDHLKWGDVADYRHHINWLLLMANDKFRFIETDSRSPEAVPFECDFLFIDTYHNYGHLSQELAVHGHKANKFLGFHDIITFGAIGDNETGGIIQAVMEYMRDHPEWKVKLIAPNNNGLLILEKQQ